MTRVRKADNKEVLTSDWKEKGLSIKNNAVSLWQAAVNAHWGIIINEISTDIGCLRIQMLTYTCCHFLLPHDLNKAAVNAQFNI